MLGYWIPVSYWTGDLSCGDQQANRGATNLDHLVNSRLTNA